MNKLEWISVEDRLPVQQGLYLTVRGGVPGVTNWFPDIKRWRKHGGTVNPTHWMPIPDLPEATQ